MSLYDKAPKQMTNTIRKEDDTMSTFRKWRFSILIGSGIIAAGVLLYFSNARVSSDKTQGAIGKRDVYRDSQVNTADIAAPGQAPVATTAILESGEFKALAKNPAFQELLKDNSFTELKGNHQFEDLLADLNFQQMIQNSMFMGLLKSDALAQALGPKAELNMRDSQVQSAIFNAIRSDSHYEALRNDAIFNQLVHNSAFNSLLLNMSFRALMSSSAFNSLATSQLFNSLLMNGSFRQNLLSLSSSQLLMGNTGNVGGGAR